MVRVLRGLSLFVILLPLIAYSQEVKIKGVIYQRYEGERLVWKLFSDTFEQKGEEFKAEKVYLENLPRGLKIYANLSLYQKREDKFYFKGEVRLITEKEGEVYTEELFYYPGKGLLYAPGEVTIVKNTFHLSGSGLTYDLSTGDLKLQRKAQARFKL